MGYALNVRMEGHTSYVRSVTFSPDGAIIASGACDNTVRTWDAKSGQALKVLDGHISSVFSVTFSPNVIVSGSYDHSVRLWDAKPSYAILHDDHSITAAHSAYEDAQSPSPRTSSPPALRRSKRQRS